MCVCGIQLEIVGMSAFFFFKRKTAYEMRISDWSSDVCSSDLHAEPMSLDDALRLAETRAPELQAREAGLEDRKSVVEGKSVSVRVDLGGRRIIKKQTQTDRRQYNTGITDAQHTYQSIEGLAIAQDGRIM